MLFNMIFLALVASFSMAIPVSPVKPTSVSSALSPSVTLTSQGGLPADINNPTDGTDTVKPHCPRKVGGLLFGIGQDQGQYLSLRDDKFPKCVALGSAKEGCIDSLDKETGTAKVTIKGENQVQRRDIQKAEQVSKACDIVLVAGEYVSCGDMFLFAVPTQVEKGAVPLGVSEVGKNGPKETEFSPGEGSQFTSDELGDKEVPADTKEPAAIPVESKETKLEPEAKGQAGLDPLDG
ncbi:hypothetical protein NEOLI_002414 [Neolecta irregularis DAH-3]|uniref:Uncharacterized protein n=1 Tax=Neolecta irregularis (strain DAH-3) TaxID=1198029 RepID=A0A1U7LIB5_NEOID|nr:hypothetical protein NEOLI_002414 [Neolecta irregularis DAH-3]|eukprot:OLL22368.1 hypothetical protein NEOLI_002414 [Neolecta irregularis DAH-3]